jgi:adenosylcobinamide-phosphate synthase
MLLFDRAGPGIEFLLLAALVLDAYVGDLPWLFRFLPHPIALIGRAIDWCDRKLNRPQRPPGVLRVRGLLTVLVLGSGAVGIGLGLHWLARNYPQGWLVELLVITLMVAQRGLYDHVATVRRALDLDGLVAARRAVSHIVGRDPDALDEHGVARAAIESLAENFADGVVAPVFWYLVAGLPGLVLYKTVNTMDSMIGHRTERYEQFGKVAARLDDAMNWVPARIAGLLIAAGALVTAGTRRADGFGVMWRDHAKHASPNAGWPEAAMAGALGLALNGPRIYGGEVVAAPWVGDGRALAMAEDIGRALAVFRAACTGNALIAGLMLAAWTWLL